MTEIIFYAALLVFALCLIPWSLLGLAMLGVGFPRITIRQVLGLAAVVAIGCGGYGALFQDTFEWYFTGITLLIALIFAGMWVYEFQALVLRRDDEFAGRFDKLSLMLGLILFAPAGVWLARLYRRTRLLEKAQAPPRDLQGSGD